MGCQLHSWIIQKEQQKTKWKGLLYRACSLCKRQWKLWPPETSAREKPWSDLIRTATTEKEDSLRGDLRVRGVSSPQNSVALPHRRKGLGWAQQRPGVPWEEEAVKNKGIGIPVVRFMRVHQKTPILWTFGFTVRVWDDVCAWHCWNSMLILLHLSYSVLHAYHGEARDPAS